ncbi:MAG: Hsp70 family protein [Opitutaceae bacterium]|jgi:molecular chaperone DnaK|nr:Hsp70 family protein [Opitutaceae bacterium]
MPSTTIDFGIDLGTTNSAIAALRGQATQIIKNNRSQDITPSAVSIVKNARTGEMSTYVGDPAKNNYIQGRGAVLEFKRDMGSDRVYPFAKAGVKRTPVELSAEILKALRGDVQRVTGEAIDAAVITVPAVFPQPANDATKRAAGLAGFKQALTIQEPVAAAIAYGYQKKITENQYWLVFDFGGGTFDAALIRANRGVFTTQNHRGDNFLGGADIDWAILERLVIPQLTGDYTLPGFKRGAVKWEHPLRLLKYAVEQAKITLSGQENTDLQGPVFEDTDGAEVDYSTLSLSRADVARAASPLIDRAVALCKELLAESKLKPGDLAKVILVGGPTQASYFRDTLREYFGGIIDFSHNPMTVVAEGAAIFASQKLKDTAATTAAGTAAAAGRRKTSAPSGVFTIDWLNYNPAGSSAKPMVSGKLSSPGVKDFSGYRIEFANKTTGERSGGTACGADGTFIATLHAKDGERNFFDIELKDAQGLRKETSPSEIHYTVSAPMAKPTVINSLGIALADNTVEIAFKKGETLPQKKRHLRQSAGGVFRTTTPIKAGDKDTCLRVTVVEGEEKRADLNRDIGGIAIDGTMVHGDLDIGTGVEIYLKMDEDRSLFLSVVIPDVDVRIMDKPLSLEMVEMDPEKLRKKYLKWLQRPEKAISTLKNCETGAGDPELAALIDEVSNWRASEKHREIENKLDAAAGKGEGWTVAVAQADQLLREFMGKVYELEDHAELPEAIKTTESLTDMAEKGLMAVGARLPNEMRVKFQQELEQARDMLDSVRKKTRQSYAKARDAGVLDDLVKIKKNIGGIVFIVMAPPIFKDLGGRESQATNRSAYRALMQAGMAAIMSENLLKLAEINRQLMELLPGGYDISRDGHVQ